MPAAASSAASDPAGSGLADASTSVQSPVRTCIGCRQRAAAVVLLRVVATPGAAGQPLLVVPDPRRRIPGRGAWLHPDVDCAELAERRRAYARALRAAGSVDPTPVRAYLADQKTRTNTARPTVTGGTPQESQMDAR